MYASLPPALTHVVCPHPRLCRPSHSDSCSERDPDPDDDDDDDDDNNDNEGVNNEEKDDHHQNEDDEDNDDDGDEHHNHHHDHRRRRRRRHERHFSNGAPPDSNVDVVERRPVSDVSTLLDLDERYEIYVVKCSERPHLIGVDESDDNGGDDHYHDHDHHVVERAICNGDDNGEGSSEDKDEGDSNDTGRRSRDGDGDEEKKRDQGVKDDEDGGVVGGDNQGRSAEDGTGQRADANRNNNDDDDQDENDGNEPIPPPPLIDGCDLPGWRRERLVAARNDQAQRPKHEAAPVSDHVQGGLNVGAGSTLFRRESVLPILSIDLDVPVLGREMAKGRGVGDGVVVVVVDRDGSEGGGEAEVDAAANATSTYTSVWSEMKRKFMSEKSIPKEREAPCVTCSEYSRLVDVEVEMEMDVDVEDEYESESESEINAGIDTIENQMPLSSSSDANAKEEINRNDYGGGSGFGNGTMEHQGNVRRCHQRKKFQRHTKMVTMTKFARDFERCNVPAKILGCASRWKAMPSDDFVHSGEIGKGEDADKDENGNGNETEANNNAKTREEEEEGAKEKGGQGWTFDNLCRRFGNVRWRFSDTHGEMMPLSTYGKYVRSIEGALLDDSPLAIYDSEFGNDDSPTTRVLVDEYDVPSCFSMDLFDLATTLTTKTTTTTSMSTMEGGGDCARGGGGEEEEKCKEEEREVEEDEDEETEEVSKEESDDDGDGDCGVGGHENDNGGGGGGKRRSNGDSSSDSSSGSGGDRPPYRWILIGPERSGTGMHVDPLWTNAWVTVLQGMKRWVLFPPSTPPERIGMVHGKPQIPSSIWFRDYYDLVTSSSSSSSSCTPTCASATAAANDGDNDNSNSGWPLEWTPVEVLQRPGETVFVPNGWPHAVVNLDLTVAVTHNYASEHGPFLRMWDEVEQDEPAFASRWLDGLSKTRPDLADRVLIRRRRVKMKNRQ